jgi:hypothetical protein
MEPFVKFESEMMTIIALLRTSPFYLHEPLAQQADACYATFYWLRHYTYQLRDLHQLGYHKHNGPIAFKEAVALHCVKRHDENLRREVDIRSAEWRRHLKSDHRAEARQAASSPNFSSLNPMFEEVQISQTQRAKEHIALRKERYAYTELAFHSRPVEWHWAGFHIAFHRIQKVNRVLLEVLYKETKFWWAPEFTKRQSKSRVAAWARFRYILDEISYETLRIFSTNKQCIWQLVDELTDLRQYRITKYPQSVSEQDVARGRSLFMQLKRISNPLHRTKFATRVTSRSSSKVEGAERYGERPRERLVLGVERDQQPQNLRFEKTSPNDNYRLGKDLTQPKVSIGNAFKEKGTRKEDSGLVFDSMLEQSGESLKVLAR